MVWVDQLRNLLREPPRHLEALGLPWLLRAVVVLAFQASVIAPWAIAAHFIRSHAPPSSAAYTRLTGILFAVCLLGLLYVLRIVVPMVRHDPRRIEDQGRCFYYWRRTLPVLALLTLVTGAKFLSALSR